MTLLPALLVVVALAAPAVRVEAPDEKGTLEVPARAPKQLAARCEVLIRRYSKPSVDGVAELFYCLQNPAPDVRMRSLWALDASAPMDRPDFREAFLPRLQEAVRLGSSDSSLRVRYAAGDLSRSLQFWQAQHPLPRQRQAMSGAAKRRLLGSGLQLAFWLVLLHRLGRRRRR